MSIDEDDYEMNFYLKILQVYQNNQLDEETVEIWKNKSYIELMSVLERTKNKNLVKNAILLILSLFEDLPVDYLHHHGKDTKELKKKEKQNYLAEMRAEFLNGLLN